MPKLSELSIADRTSQMLTVLRLTHELKDEGKKEYWSIEEACATVGMTRDQYYYWLTKSPEAVEAFRQLISDYGRVELASIMAMQGEITDRLIRDALANTTDPMARLAIIKYMNERQEMLAGRHKAVGTDAAREFMKGINLQSAESSFGETQQQTVNIKPREDGSLDVTFTKKNDVIEVVEVDRSDEPAESTRTTEPLPSPVPLLSGPVGPQSTDQAERSPEQSVPGGGGLVPWA